MSLIADGLLIATCLTAALYCYVLSRRLKDFSNTDDGIGQQIIQLNATLEETRTALKETQASAKKASEALAREITQARKMATQLRNLIDEAGAVPAEAPKASNEPAPKAAKPASSKASARAAAPVLPLETPVEDAEPDVDEGLDIESVDIDELRLEPDPGEAHEQALGFVPDADVDLDDEDIPDELEAEGTGDAGDESVADNPVPEGEQDESLLKVERMAL